MCLIGLFQLWSLTGLRRFENFILLLPFKSDGVLGSDLEKNFQKLFSLSFGQVNREEFEFLVL